jgi:hypothetical protein
VGFQSPITKKAQQLVPGYCRPQACLAHRGGVHRLPIGSCSPAETSTSGEDSPWELQCRGRSSSAAARCARAALFVRAASRTSWHGKVFLGYECLVAGDSRASLVSAGLQKLPAIAISASLFLFLPASSPLPTSFPEDHMPVGWAFLLHHPDEAANCAPPSSDSSSASR